MMERSALSSVKNTYYNLQVQPLNEAKEHELTLSMLDDKARNHEVSYLERENIVQRNVRIRRRVHSVIEYTEKKEDDDVIDFNKLDNDSFIWDTKPVSLPDLTKLTSPPKNEIYALPLVEKPQVDSKAFGSISPTTLSRLMELNGPRFFKKFILVDCRYPYEYEGGHIKGAINIYDEKDLEIIFFPQDSHIKTWQQIPIFYCEFSQKRGPSMAQHLRSLDRVRNAENYPHVHYREIYLLDQGYSKFWSIGANAYLCEPQNYIKMDDEQYQNILCRMDRHKKNSYRRLRFDTENSAFRKSIHLSDRDLGDDDVFENKPIAPLEDDNVFKDSITKTFEISP